MKRTRRIVAAAAIAAVIAIPGTASAEGNCVGATAKVMHTAFRTLPGGVGEFLSGVREDPSGFPWCSE